MIPYSIHVAILLATCLLFYKLLLQKETYYRLNRVILLTCLVLAFVLPLIPVPGQFSLVNSHESGVNSQESIVNISQLPVTPADIQPRLNNHEEVYPANKPANTTASVTPVTDAGKIAIKPQAGAPVIKALIPGVPLMQRVIKWAFWLYWCGVAAFGANLLLQIIVLLYQAYKKPAMKDGIYRIVELDGDKAPCSFGNSIFINPTKYDWETYNQILMHEKVHIQQGHSFDLVTAELMLVMQWFNPFAWLYRKELESNLEFLTDDSVLHDHKVEPAEYQLSLLKVSVPNFSMSIATNYNQSLLKKRIVMMNAKRSNIHTMWKYFMLMPLLVALVCGLNKPIAMGQQKTAFNVNRPAIDFSHGTWFATINADKVYIQFQGDDNDEHHSWSSSHNFSLSDFPNMPKGDKADFTLTREAGTVVFNGKFDGDQGMGHYKFTANKDFITFMGKPDNDNDANDEAFQFFMADVKKEYVTFLRENGFKDIPRYQIISMSSQKVDAAYIKYWKDLGYSNLTPQQLVSLKSQKVDADYVNDIRKAGYTDLSVQQLLSFHQQHITGDYINSLKKASVKEPGAATAEKPTVNEIMSSKRMNIDSAYVAGIRGAGYTVNNYNQLSTLKSMNITPGYIKSFEAVGFTDVPPNVLYNMKSQEITPEYVKAFKDMGYSNQDIQRLVTMKREGITPEYIKSFEAVGYRNIPVNSLYGLSSSKVTPMDIKGYQAVGYGAIDDNGNMLVTVNSKNPGDGHGLTVTGSTVNEISSFKAQGITPEYIKTFQALGYKDIPFSSFRMLKSAGITPEYIKSFEAVGYQNIPYNSLVSMKRQEITPEFVKGFQDVGYKDIPYPSLVSLKQQGITPEFVKGFQDVGYKDIPYPSLVSLKRQDITPEFVKGFQDVGYKDIHYPTLISLKEQGITPQFVTEMKQKGFDSKDLNKYIELKNFNANPDNSGAKKVGRGQFGALQGGPGRSDSIGIRGLGRPAMTMAKIDFNNARPVKRGFSDTSAMKGRARAVRPKIADSTIRKGRPVPVINN